MNLRAPQPVRALVAACVALAPSARAQPPKDESVRVMAVVASGDCGDVELLEHARGLSRALAKQPGIVVPDETDLFRTVAREPSKSFDEVKAEIDEAQQEFYEGQYTRSLRQVEAALTEVARLPPGRQRWDLEVNARILEGLVRTRIRGDRSNYEAFRRVLRLAPDHKLDPDFFGPSTIELFERVRDEIARERRVPLEVDSQPAGAEVFLDGRAVGTTPFRGTFPEGTYQLLVGTADAASLPRALYLRVKQPPRPIHVDLQFERAIHATRALCLASGGDEAIRTRNAAKLGALLELDALVVLRLRRPRQRPSWLLVDLVAVREARALRGGGVEILSGAEAALDALARFVATGVYGDEVVPPPIDLERPSAIELPTAASPPAATPTPVAPTTAPEFGSPRPSQTGYRAAAFAAGGLGVVATGTGLVFLALSGTTRTELEALNADRLQADEADRARGLVDLLTTRETVAYSTLGLGALALGGGIVLFLLDRHLAEQPHAPRLSLTPSAGGAALSFSGTF